MRMRKYTALLLVILLFASLSGLALANGRAEPVLPYYLLSSATETAEEIIPADGTPPEIAMEHIDPGLFGELDEVVTPVIFAAAPVDEFGLPSFHGFFISDDTTQVFIDQTFHDAGKGAGEGIYEVRYDPNTLDVFTPGAQGEAEIYAMDAAGNVASRKVHCVVQDMNAPVYDVLGNEAYTLHKRAQGGKTLPLGASDFDNGVLIEQSGLARLYVASLPRMGGLYFDEQKIEETPYVIEWADIRRNRLSYRSEASGEDSFRFYLEDTRGNVQSAEEAMEYRMEIIAAGTKPVLPEDENSTVLETSVRAADDGVIMNGRREIVIDVLKNDVAFENAVLSIASVTDGAHGTAVVENGRIRYTFAPEKNGTEEDRFSYTLAYEGERRRGAVLRANVYINDTSAPAISDLQVESADNNVWRAAREIRLRIEDNTKLAYAAIHVRTQTPRGYGDAVHVFTGRGPMYTADITQNGQYYVVAEDATGNRAVEPFTISYADGQGPEILPVGNINVYNGYLGESVFRFAVRDAESGFDRLAVERENGRALNNAVIEKTGTETYTVDLSACDLSGGQVVLAAYDALGNRSEFSLGRLSWDREAPVFTVDHANAEQEYFLPRRIRVADEKSGVASVQVGGTEARGEIRTEIYWYGELRDEVRLAAADHVGNASAHAVYRLPIPDPRGIVPWVEEALLQTAIEKIEAERAALMADDPYYLTFAENLQLDNTLTALKWELGAIAITKGVYPVLTEENIAEAKRLTAEAEAMNRAVRGLLNEILVNEVRAILYQALEEDLAVRIAALPETPVHTWTDAQIKACEDMLIECFEKMPSEEHMRFMETVTGARLYDAYVALSQYYGIPLTSDLSREDGVYVAVIGLMTRLEAVPAGARLTIEAVPLTDGAIYKTDPAYLYLGGCEVRILAEAPGQTPVEAAVKPGERLLVQMPVRMPLQPDYSTLRIVRDGKKSVSVVYDRTLQQAAGVWILTGELGRFEQFACDTRQAWDLFGRPVGTVEELPSPEGNLPPPTPTPPVEMPLPVTPTPVVPTPAPTPDMAAPSIEADIEDEPAAPAFAQAGREEPPSGAENWPFILIVGGTLLAVVLRIAVSFRKRGGDQ